MELPREETAGKVPDDGRLDVPGLDSRIGNGRRACLDDQIPDRFSFFAQISLKIGPAGPDHMDGLTHVFMTSPNQ